MTITDRLAVIERALQLAWRTTADALAELGKVRKQVAGLELETAEAYLSRQWEWSHATFGAGKRTNGILSHIRKELAEIEAKPEDLSEWIDVAILAMASLHQFRRCTSQLARAYSQRKDGDAPRHRGAGDVGGTPPVTPSDPAFSPIPCHKCPGKATKVAAEPSGGHRYRCRTCRATFVHGGPGKAKLPARLATEAARLMMEDGLSIREASRQVGIAKGTGRAIFRRVALLRSAELVRLAGSPVEARAEADRLIRGMR